MRGNFWISQGIEGFRGFQRVSQGFERRVGLPPIVGGLRLRGFTSLESRVRRLEHLRSCRPQLRGGGWRHPSAPGAHTSIPDTGPSSADTGYRAPGLAGAKLRRGASSARQARRGRFPVSYRPESQKFLRSLRSRKIGQNFLRSLRSRASPWTRFGVCASRRPQPRLVRLPLEIFILGPS